jgi:pilus assembly protein Flp/PilA
MAPKTAAGGGKGVNMKTFLMTFLKDESGASAAEYALILAVVGVAIGAAALTLGDNVGAAITNASNSVRDCGSAAAENDDVAGTTFASVTECADAGTGGTGGGTTTTE